MSIREPRFASEDNFYNITRNFAFIGIMALGLTAVIITGGIDLSVGSIMGLVARRLRADAGGRLSLVWRRSWPASPPAPSPAPSTAS